MLTLKHKSNGSRIAARDWIVRITEDGKMLLNTGLDKWSEVVADVASEPAPVPVDASPAPDPVVNEPEPTSAVVGSGPAALPGSTGNIVETIYMTGDWLDLNDKTDIVIKGYGKRIRLNRCQRVLIDGTVNRLEPTINFGIEIRDSTDVTVRNCDVEGPINAYGLFGTKRFHVIGNKANKVGGDAFKFGSCEQGVIERNRGVIDIAVLEGAHPDFMQLQGICRRMIIRYNINLNYGQGIFSGQGPHEDIEVHDNVLLASHANQIYLIGSGLWIHHNTILRKPGTTGKTAYINVTQSPGAANLIESNNVQVKNKGASGIGPYGLTLQTEDSAHAFYQPDFADLLPGSGPWLDPGQLAVNMPGYGARLDLI